MELPEDKISTFDRVAVFEKTGMHTAFGLAVKGKLSYFALRVTRQFGRTWLSQWIAIQIGEAIDLIDTVDDGYAE